MDDLKNKVRGIFKKDTGGNSYYISDMHRYLNEGKFSIAKEIMKDKLSVSKEDAEILIAYYKKRLKSTVSFEEINIKDVVADDDFVDGKEYLFVYGQGVYQSKVINRRDGLRFFNNKEFVNIDKARQIFLINWSF